MKRNVFGFMALALFIAACTTAQPKISMADELDLVIREASDYLNKNVPSGSKLVILNIKSDYPPLSEYIIDVLTGNVVNDRIFTVVDRANLTLIQQELDFQFSGEVSDESAQSIGQKLGAQTIVSGSITPFGNLWRLTIRALGVEGATVQGLFNKNIPNGASMAALTSGGAVTVAASGAVSGGGAVGARQAAQVGAAQPVPTKNSEERASPTPSVPKQTLPATGTYTLLPQPVAYQGTTQTTFLISKIEVRGNYMTLFLINTANRGMSGFRRTNAVMPLWDTSNLITIKDLDTGRTYNPIDFTDGFNSKETTITFENVMARRFSLTGSYANPPIVFDEIIIGVPD
jgi:hypothetical protein